MVLISHAATSVPYAKMVLWDGARRAKKCVWLTQRPSYQSSVTCKASCKSVAKMFSTDISTIPKLRLNVLPLTDGFLREIVHTSARMGLSSLVGIRTL